MRAVLILPKPLASFPFCASPGAPSVSQGFLWQVTASGQHQAQESRWDARRGKVFTRLIKGSRCQPNSAAPIEHEPASASPSTRPMRRTCGTTSGAIKRRRRAGRRRLRGDLHEGYGIGGAVMVDCLTDNRTRTVADVRHAFTKDGGNLGAGGAEPSSSGIAARSSSRRRERGQIDGNGDRGRRR